jgi:protein dithiol oxidoreductase (disulfide-forming)
MKIVNMILRVFVLMICFAALAHAEAVVNKEYVAINPTQPTESGRKIEVIEFFYYGCPHCFDLEPVLEVWLKQKPKDVEFRRVPIVFRDSWIPLTKAYYAFEALGVLDKVHHDFFIAVQKERLAHTKEALTTWAGAHGVDAKQFGDTFDSFGVQGKVQKSMQVGRSYGVTGTPSIAVDGKYLTSPSMTLSSDDVIDYRKFTRVLNELIAKARKERGATKG